MKQEVVLTDGGKNEGEGKGGGRVRGISSRGGHRHMGIGRMLDFD